MRTDLQFKCASVAPNSERVVPTKKRLQTSIPAVIDTLSIRLRYAMANSEARLILCLRDQGKKQPSLAFVALHACVVSSVEI